jgi:hypothetical protein
MVLDSSLIILTVRSKEKFLDLRRPIEIRHHPISSVVVIFEGDSMRKNVMGRSIFGLELILQHLLNHVSLTMIKHLLHIFRRTIEKISEVSRFNDII